MSITSPASYGGQISYLTSFYVVPHLTSNIPKAVSQTYEWNLFCLQLKGNGYDELLMQLP